MLGAPFALEGKVVQGQGIGSKQTVPTLNLAPLNEVLPKTGVYVTRTRDLRFDARMEVHHQRRLPPDIRWRGTDRRDIPAGTPRRRATPARIEVSFLLFVRDERKFETPEALKAQILRDVGVANGFTGGWQSFAWDNCDLRN